MKVPNKELQDAGKIKGNAMLFAANLYYAESENGFIVSAGSSYVESHNPLAEVKSEQEAKDLIVYLKNTLVWILTH